MASRPHAERSHDSGIEISNDQLGFLGRHADINDITESRSLRQARIERIAQPVAE